MLPQPCPTQLHFQVSDHFKGCHLQDQSHLRLLGLELFHMDSGEDTVYPTPVEALANVTS